MTPYHSLSYITINFPCTATSLYQSIPLDVNPSKVLQHSEILLFPSLSSCFKVIFIMKLASNTSIKDQRQLLPHREIGYIKNTMHVSNTSIKDQRCYHHKINSWSISL